MGPVYVAQLNRSMDCTWSERAPAPITGGLLAIGQRLTLDKGVAEIAMNNGTSLVIEGPTTLDFHSAECVGLMTGALKAKVSKEAIGFTVWTPNAVVVRLRHGVRRRRQPRAE